MFALDPGLRLVQQQPLKGPGHVQTFTKLFEYYNKQLFCVTHL